MTVNVHDAGPFEKLVSFAMSADEVDAAKTAAARRLAREVKIRGFRPGKAPRPIVEATVGAERLRSEAIDHLLPEKLGSILQEIDLLPAVTPQLESIEDRGAEVDVEVRVTLWPQLESVPTLSGRDIEVGSPAVTESELDRQLDRIRDQYAQLETVERAAEPGDFVSIDISATHDGEPVEEARASQLLYEVGSGGFIEGIDPALEGLSAGESATFEGLLPAGFGELAGSAVVYVVDVTEVRRKVLPDLTDEWVSEVSEYETVAEVKESLHEQMTEAKKQSLAVEFRQRALDGVVDEVDVVLPEALVRAEMDELFHRFSQRLRDQGVELEDYFRVTGIGQEAFLDDLRSQADRSLRTRLLLEAVARQEGIQVEEDELTAVIESVVQQADEPEEARTLLRQSRNVQSIAGDILRSKALDAVVAGARPVDENGSEIDLTVEEPAPEPPAVVEGEVVVGDVVEGQIVGDETPDQVEAEIVEAELIGPSEEE